MLTLRNVEAGYGPVTAIRGVSLQVPPGAIVALLGANGAGKTSVLKTISGVLRLSKGSIHLQEQRVDGSSPETVVQQGVAHAPEGRELFALLTVHENLRLGAYVRSDDEVGVDMETAYGYFPELRHRRDALAGQLSGGQQQMLAIARSLMSRPRLLLLDEPSSPYTAFRSLINRLA